MTIYLLSNNSIYAQNYSSINSSNSNNDNNYGSLEITNDTTTLLSYKFQPFLLLDGTIFKDIFENMTKNMK